jgi:ubiquinone/menaquinone biosynthesis C-methylase UbiE
MSEAQLFAAMSFAEIYERVLVGPLFRPFAEQLIARLNATADDSVIDVACGTGIAARIARETLGPNARVVGVDVAPTMLAVARKADPTIDWREGNAAALPADAGQFTCAACHQGMQFFPDKANVAREMRRVLAPGGRLAIATWCSLQDLRVALELNDIAERHVGSIVDVRHGLGNADALEALLKVAGFHDVALETVSHDVRFGDGALYARLNAMAVIGMSEKGKTLNEAERGELAGRIAADSSDVIARSTTDGVFVLPLATHIATARA